MAHKKANARKPPADRGKRAAYTKHKAAAAKRQRAQSIRGRDIGELPPVADPKRKAAALACLQTFCETYFRHRFHLAWSPTHLELIAAIQRVVTHGGRDAQAVERGFGKTSLLEVAAIWAVLKGLHLFVQLIGSSKPHAVEMLDSIRGELEDNELLGDDFPKVCYPIAMLEGIANRAAGQLYNGQRTKVAITKEEITLPTIPGSPASGAIIRVTGITGRIRGRKKRLVRPSLVLIDDPQTDASAKSLTQTDKRESIITGAVLGLAGPDREIAVLMAGTVIESGDLMDRFLDPQRHKDWTKHRYQMLPEFPKEMRLWEEYWSIRTDELRQGGTGTQATAFYRDRRELMDEGAIVSWPERRRPGELSAVQHALNLYFADPEAFWKEYQNAPREAALGDGQLQFEALEQRTNGLARGVVPLKATHVTAFIDVQQRLLYWEVCAWADDFTGAIIDYGTWPDQQRAYFTAADAPRTLARATAGAGVEGAIRAGLQRCVEIVLAREWKREDGVVLPLERVLVDSAWQTDTVFAFCRSLPQPQKAIVMASKGLGIGARSVPMSEYPRREGERPGDQWILKTATATKRASRHVQIDTNHWKTFVCARLQQAAGDRGALTIFGRPADPDHRLLCEHLSSEFWVETQGRGRKLHEWTLRPGRTENHWFDGLVGCAAAASMQGCALVAGEGTPALGTKKKVSFAQRQAEKRGRRSA